MTSGELFNGFMFYFDPPKALCGFHGLRAKISAKNGARIQDTPDESTTHILVANRTIGDSFRQIMEHYAVKKDVQILSSDWISDSIEHKQLMDTDNYAVALDWDKLSDSKALESSPEVSLRADSPSDECILTNEHVHVEEHALSETHSSSEDQSSPMGHSFGKDRSQKSNSLSDCNSYRSNPSPKKAKRENAMRYDAPVSPPVRTSHQNSFEAANIAKEPQKILPLPENQIFIDLFRDLMLNRRAVGEEYSARAYERTLREIERTHIPIVSGCEFRARTGISKRMAELIDQIRTGKINPLLTQGQRNRVETLQLFTTVYGVGPVNARLFYNRGCRTLSDLAKVVDDNGQVSIKHHKDFTERISRFEVTQHFETVKKLVTELDASINVFCMGSYRRGEENCGDIDIIMTKPGADLKGLKFYLKKLLAIMFDNGLAQHTFTKGSDRWLGATQVTGKWRRMDILLVPSDELGAAMIYYTGNDQYNRKLRLHAKQNNMRLNHNGLFKVESDGTLTLMEAHNEERIFEILNQPFLPPEERII